MDDSPMNQELERFEPAEAGGRIAYEHLHRYAMCRDQVVGLRVLDVACGAGYGGNLLAEVAADVVELRHRPICSPAGRPRSTNAKIFKFVTAALRKHAVRGSVLRRRRRK